MQVLHQLEALRQARAVMDRDPDFADVREDAGWFDYSLPSEVGELVGERGLEIAAGVAEVREALQFRFGHHGLREHRGARLLLCANDRLNALMLQAEQARQRDAKDSDRDHHLQQREGARPLPDEIHCAIPVGITSPLTMDTWPVSGENSSVITSPEASSR